MMRTRSVWSFVPPFVLTAIIGTVAAAVELYAHPAGGLQVQQSTDILEDPGIRTGSLNYPREASDRTGARVVIKHPPQRVVSQALSLDEFVYLLVPPKTVVGASRYASDKRFSNVYDKAKQYEPAVAADPERVVSLSPDLVLVSSISRADYTNLVRSTGVPTLRMQTQFSKLEQIAEMIRVTGYVLGADEAASREEARFRGEIAKAAALRPANAAAPRVLGLSGQFAFGSKTLFDDIVKTVGGVNVATTAGVKGLAEVSSESIAHWDPDWIVTGSNPEGAAETRAQLLRDPGISITRAARDGHILVLENNIFEANSPFVTNLVSQMADAMYGVAQPVAGAR
jgi:iron complex transport system substrate-binding protein